MTEKLGQFPQMVSQQYGQSCDCIYGFRRLCRYYDRYFCGGTLCDGIALCSRLMQSRQTFADRVICSRWWQRKTECWSGNGHTEATVDLCRLAGLKECGLCCEIMREDGTMMRTSELIELARKWDLKFITIQALQAYRKCHDEAGGTGDRKPHARQNMENLRHTDL